MNCLKSKRYEEDRDRGFRRGVVRLGTLHEAVEIEIIRPPQVQDTVTIPDWELKE